MLTYLRLCRRIRQDPGYVVKKTWSLYSMSFWKGLEALCQNSLNFPPLIVHMLPGLAIDVFKHFQTRPIESRFSGFDRAPSFALCPNFLDRELQDQIISSHSRPITLPNSMVLLMKSDWIWLSLTNQDLKIAIYQSTHVLELAFLTGLCNYGSQGLANSRGFLSKPHVS